MESQTLEKKRQRFHVEINKKRVTQVVMNSRARHTQIPKAAIDLVDQATKFASNNNQFGLHKLIEEFLHSDSEDNAQQLIRQLLEQTDNSRLLISISVLTIMYEKQDINLPTSELVAKLVSLDHHPYIQGLKLLGVIFSKDKPSCLWAVDSGMLDTILSRMYSPDASAPTFNLVESICTGLEVMIDIQNHKASIVRLLGTILNTFNLTNNIEYLKLHNQLVDELNDDDIALSLIEDYMHTLDDCLKILLKKETSAINLQVIKLLNLLFMSEDTVVQTLLKSGFQEYIITSIHHQDYKIKAQAVGCIENILFSNDRDIVQHVLQSQILQQITQLANQTFCCYAVTDINMEHTLLKTLSNSFYNYQLDVDWKMFIMNCQSRLECQQLQFQCLSLIKDLDDQLDNCYEMLEQSQIIKTIEWLSHTSKNEEIRKQADRLL